MFLRRSLIILAAAVPLVLAAASAASASGASRVPLEANTSGLCNSGPFPGSPQFTHSFAVIGATASGRVFAEVAVFGAAPNTTYSLALVQTPSGHGCLKKPYSLTTNSNGNGTVHISQPELAGTTGAFVLFPVHNGVLRFAATPAVSLSGHPHSLVAGARWAG